MTRKSIVAAFGLLAVLGITALAQNKPLVYTIGPKLSIGTLNTGQPDEFQVRGKASFTLTAANSDDTLVGTLTYALPDDARQKLAQLTGKPLAQIPATQTVKDVNAEFQKTTACPIVHIEIKPMDMTIAGAKLRFTKKTVLDIQGREPGSLQKYTPAQEMEIQFCVWTKQINNSAIRRGVIQRVNGLIAGEPAQ
jgi:hypothetical protein